jgi:hypothetical protein
VGSLGMLGEQFGYAGERERERERERGLIWYV